jgi:alanyl aminopeptidase
MENAGLVIYRDAYMLIGPDSPADRYRAVFNITAHEVAHQWYGDLVTVPWWDDIWLNEAYATWAQAKVTVALKPEYHADLEALEGRMFAMANDSLLSARKIRQPIRGEGDILTAFDAITYQKGAAVLAMFERWVGEERFRAGMRAYLARRAFGSGSSDDLIATLAEASGKGEAFAGAMRSFLDQPGVPMIAASMSCEDGKGALRLAQSRYLPFGVLAKDESRWSVPFCARFGRKDGNDSQCFLLEQPTQEFDVEGGCADWFLPNADARGYYRFELAPEDFARLGSAIPTLSAAEQMVFADALSAAFRRGTVSTATVLDAMPALAGSNMPQVATALLKDFEWIREHVADEATRPLLDAWVVRLYAPQVQRLGWRRAADEPGTNTALRTRLAEFLAIGVRDPATRVQLAKQGRAALGLDAGKVDLSRADADLLETALKVTVQDGGVAAFDAAQKAFEAERDTTRRYALLSGLGATRDAALGERVRDYGLTPAVQVGELARIYGAQMDERENRAAMWQWLVRKFDAYRARLPAFAQSRLPRIFSLGSCSDADAERVSSFLAPRIKHLTGGERGLGQTLEGIRQCGALRGHVDRAVLAEWAAAHARP